MDGGKKADQPHGDVAEEDPGRRQRSVVDEADGDEKAPHRSKRVASLDVFRGLTVAVSGSLPSPRPALSGFLIVAKLVVGRFLNILTTANQKLNGGKCSILFPLVAVSN